MDSQDSFNDLLYRHPLGFLTLKNPPSHDELETYYKEKYFQLERGSYRKEYSKQEIDFFDLKIAQKYWEASNLIQNKKGYFLDVGCGEGFALSWFNKHGWKVDGIDFSSVGIERYNPLIIKNVDIGNIFKLIEERLNQKRKYDLVFLANVLEHVVDPVSLMRSLKDLVAEGGCLVVTVPNDGSQYQEHMLNNSAIKERFWIALPDHISYFTNQSLKRIAVETGWDCNQILADFPIDWFLLHPSSNYINDRENGPGAHMARVEMENFIGAHNTIDKVNAFYASLASIGLGRNITAFLTPSML